MQKVVQRALRARSLRERKIARHAASKERDERWERAQQIAPVVKEHRANLKQAKLNWREDWAKGPLAPRRDVGENARFYGALSAQSTHPPAKEPKDRLKWKHIVEGDRVVLVRGRERGRIGEVLSYDEESDCVMVRGTNVVDIAVPDWLRQEAGATSNISSRPFHIPVEDVKLVYALPDPKTGLVRDRVIDRVEQVRVVKLSEAQKAEAAFDELNALKRGKQMRAVPGTPQFIIPWPDLEEEEKIEHPVDTTQELVDEVTFLPYLRYPPIPLKIVDELRNKYSRYRTVHEPEYLEKQQAAEAQVERRKQLALRIRGRGGMDITEMHARQQAARERKLTDAQLAVIGKAIMKERKESKQLQSRQQIPAEA